MTYLQKDARINYFKNNYKNFFYSLIMWIFGEKKVTKEKFHAAKNL